MIGIERLTQLIRLTLFTAHLEGEKPISLLIVSDRPESGKTQVIKKFNKNKKVALVTDATAFGIWRDFRDSLEKNEINHLLFPDFLTATSRQKATVESLITTLNPLIEEGLAELHTGFLKPLKITSPHPIGIILAMIKAPFEKQREEWTRNGFLSRLLVCSYKYSDDTVKAIFKSILDSEYRRETDICLSFPSEVRQVDCSLQAGAKLKMLMDKLVTKDRKLAMYGFRMLKDLRRLAMANALTEDRSTVIQADIDVVTDLGHFLNEEYKEMGNAV